MSNPKIYFKRSAVASKKPTLSNLELGELALNTNDGKIFLRRDTLGVGIGTTITTVNPWVENYGATQVEYGGNVSIVGVTTSIGGFVGDLTGDVTSTQITSDFLNVTGIATINNITYPVSDGTANQVLVTDGNGTLSFADQSGSAQDLGITTTSTSTNELLVNSFDKTTYKSAQYLIQIQRGVNTSMTQLNLVHNGSTVYLSEFGTINTGPGLSTFSARIDSGDVKILAYPATSGFTEFRPIRTLIRSGDQSIETTTTTSTSTTTFASTTGKAALLEVEITRGQSVHFSNIALVSDGTNVSITEYGILRTGPNLINFTADISGGLMRLRGNATSATSTTCKVKKTSFE